MTNCEEVLGGKTRVEHCTETVAFWSGSGLRKVGPSGQIRVAKIRLEERGEKEGEEGGGGGGRGGNGERGRKGEEGKGGIPVIGLIAEQLTRPAGLSVASNNKDSHSYQVSKNLKSNIFSSLRLFFLSFSPLHFCFCFFVDTSRAPRQFS